MRNSFLSSPNYGAFYAALSGLLFGLLGYFGLSVINAHLSTYNMLFWRFLVSSLFIFVLLLPRIKSVILAPTELIKIIFYGLAFYGSGSILYFHAAQSIGSGLAMVIFFTYPTMVMLVNFLVYKQNISKIYYLALIIILVGMLFLVHGSEFIFDLKGLGLGVLSAFLYALYIITSKNSSVPPLISTFWISIGSALVCLLCSLLSKSFLVPMDFKIWFDIGGIGIICTALPILLLLKGLKQISSLQASILSVLEPVFVVIFGIILLDEKVSLTQALGIVILLSGALLTLLSHRFEKEPILESHSDNGYREPQNFW